MDPFSLAVGVSGLVALIAQTLKLSQKYVNGVRDASKAAAGLMNELEILHSNLLHLEKFLRSDTAKGHVFNQHSSLVTTIDACRVKLQKLCSALKAVGEDRMGRVLWPLKASEHSKSMQDLRALAQWIQFTLTVDACALLSGTADDVKNTLGNQLQSLQSLQDIGPRIASIERSVREQTQLLENDRQVQDRAKMLNWISNFEDEKKHHAIRTPRVEETGDWLLKTHQFQNWRDDVESDNTLWCHGIQGSGKSVLTSLVIDRLTDHFTRRNVAIAYMYFDYRDQEPQSPEGMIRSLLRQIVSVTSEFHRSVVELYENCKKQEKPPQLQELEKALLLSCEDFQTVFIVIDALDESDEVRHRKSILQILTKLQQRSNIRLFVTSRFHPQDIAEAFNSVPRILIEANSSDLRKFLSKAIEESAAADIIDDAFKSDMVEKIARGAQKMFLLAALQIQTVVNEPTIGEMDDALDSLPHTLQDAFGETLARIQGQHDGRKRLGMNTLLLIFHAKRSLRVKELSEALAIRSGQCSLNPRYQPLQKLIVESCLGLVTVDEETSTVRLMHYSIQEFFRDHRREIFRSGDDEMAERCLTYLLFDRFKSGCCDDRGAILIKIESNPFLAYAARYWGYHTQRSSDSKIDNLALKLLQSKPKRSFSVQVYQLLIGRSKRYWEAAEANSCNELHIASLHGLQRAARAILELKDVEIDAQTHNGTTALIRAAAFGHTQIVRMLLSEHADPTRANWYGTALHCAAEAGRCETIEELLKTGMDVDFISSFGRTPIRCAVDMGRTSAVKLLLEKGADANRMLDGRMMQHWAAGDGFTRIVELLLENGADIEATSLEGMTMLHIAAWQGHTEVVQMLIEMNAKIDVRDGEGSTALFRAVRRGAKETVQALLRSGADVNARNKHGETPSTTAADLGYGDILMLLRQSLIETGGVESLGDFPSRTKKLIIGFDNQPRIEERIRRKPIIRRVSRARVVGVKTDNEKGRDEGRKGTSHGDLQGEETGTLSGAESHRVDG